MTSGRQQVTVATSSHRWVASRPKLNRSGEQVDSPSIDAKYEDSRLGGQHLTRFVQVADLHDGRLRLKSILPVTIEYFGDTVIASNADIDQFGYGDNESEALDSLRDCIVDLYFILRNETEATLGPLPARHWLFLKSVVEEG